MTSEPVESRTDGCTAPAVGSADDGYIRIPTHVIDDLAWLIGVLEDWLLHASDDTAADLAQFAGGGPFTRHPDRHARLIASQLGEHHVVLRRALKAAGMPC
jgi:hypothetical protein